MKQVVQRYPGPQETLINVCFRIPFRQKAVWMGLLVRLTWTFGKSYTWSLVDIPNLQIFPSNHRPGNGRREGATFWNLDGQSLTCSGWLIKGLINQLYLGKSNKFPIWSSQIRSEHSRFSAKIFPVNLRRFCDAFVSKILGRIFEDEKILRGWSSQIW